MDDLHEAAGELLRLADRQQAALQRDDLPALAFLMDRADEIGGSLAALTPVDGAAVSELLAVLAQLRAVNDGLVALAADKLQATGRELAALHQGRFAVNQYAGGPGEARPQHEYHA